MTLITFATGGGERRRCDDNCHAARLPECRCICGGRYHGKRGAELAAAVQDYTREIFGCYGQELAEAMTWMIHNQDVVAPRQSTLFGAQAGRQVRPGRSA